MAIKFLTRNKHSKIILSFFILCLLLTINKHNRTGYFNYHSEIWGDKSGYYSYLPGLFIYDFKADKLPENIEERIGYGFRIDSTQNKIWTKYTCGVAILQSPFYIITHLTLKFLKKNNDGFQPMNFKMINISAVFYLVLGLLLLFKFLKRYYTDKAIYYTLFILFCTTNLYYYGIVETGMSHVYSFFLFSAFLYLSGLIIKGNKKFYIEVLLGLTCGLILLIRPINLIFYTSFLFIYASSFKDISGRFKLLIKRKRLFLTSIVSIFIVIVPQLLYWKFLTGRYIYYSYEGEGFINALHPQILKVWFSTLNGQFTNVPATILFIIGIFYLYKKNRILSLYIGFIFLFCSYLFASWSSWNFGCGFGIRPFVDYMPLFAIALAAFIEDMLSNRRQLITLSVIVFILIVFNIKLTYSFDGCWYGGIWDWGRFIQWVIK